MPRLFAVLSLLLLPLALIACKPQGAATTQTTAGGTPRAQQATRPNELLLTAALANPQTASRRACVVLPGLGSEDAFDQHVYQSGSRGEAATQAGYYQVTRNPFSFAFTQKYKDLLAHSTNPQAFSTRLCLGEAHVTRLQNVEQVNPDKVVAEGATQIQYEPWVTEEVRTLFGSDRNHPMFQPIPMVCLREGSWRCEKR